MSTGQALLTALAGLHAYEAAVMPEELDALLAMGEEAPGETFVGVLALASRLAEEVRKLGGDPDALLARVYDKASELAYS
jgi:hypothetical protein